MRENVPNMNVSALIASKHSPTIAFLAAADTADFCAVAIDEQGSLLLAGTTDRLHGPFADKAASAPRNEWIPFKTPPVILQNVAGARRPTEPLGALTAALAGDSQLAEIVQDAQARGTLINPLRPTLVTTTRRGDVVIFGWRGVERAYLYAMMPTSASVSTRSGETRSVQPRETILANVVRQFQEQRARGLGGTSARVDTAESQSYPNSMRLVSAAVARDKEHGLAIGVPPLSAVYNTSLSAGHAHAGVADAIEARARAWPARPVQADADDNLLARNAPGLLDAIATHVDTLVQGFKQHERAGDTVAAATLARTAAQELFGSEHLVTTMRALEGAMRDPAIVARAVDRSGSFFAADRLTDSIGNLRRNVATLLAFVERYVPGTTASHVARLVEQPKKPTPPPPKAPADAASSSRPPPPPPPPTKPSVDEAASSSRPPPPPTTMDVSVDATTLSSLLSSLPTPPPPQTKAPVDEAMAPSAVVEPANEPSAATEPSRLSLSARPPKSSRSAFCTFSGVR